MKELRFRMRNRLRWRKRADWLDRHNPDDTPTITADASAPTGG
jgi:hypothetical protein